MITYVEATPEHAKTVHDMVLELAEYEAASKGKALDLSAKKTTGTDFERFLDHNSDDYCARAVLAICDDDKVVGQALHNVIPTSIFVSWLGVKQVKYNEEADNLGGQPRIHLDELFVRPGFRSHGIGRDLFGKVAEYAKDAQHPMTLIVDHSNIRARRLYEDLGMIVDEHKSTFDRLRLF